MDNNTFVGNVLDRGPWVLWDDQQVTQAAAIPTAWSFFNIPIGGTIVGGPLNGTTKTKLQTNMKKSNGLPQPQRFLLRSLAFYFQASTQLIDQILVTEACYFEFRIDDKIYHEGLLQFNPSGLGLDGIPGGAAGVDLVQIGQRTLTARRDYGDYARVISDALAFSLTLTFPTAVTATTTANGGNNISLIAILDGILDRLVQ
jgi:hypothetical protein